MNIIVKGLSPYEKARVNIDGFTIICDYPLEKLEEIFSQFCEEHQTDIPNGISFIVFNESRSSPGQRFYYIISCLDDEDGYKAIETFRHDAKDYSTFKQDVSPCKKRIIDHSIPGFSGWTSVTQLCVNHDNFPFILLDNYPKLHEEFLKIIQLDK